MSDDQLLREHEQTYKSFIKISFWFTLHVVVLLALMAIFLL